MINVFSAHPDDCEISIGGILLSLKSPFRVIYATKGELLSGNRDPSLFFGPGVELINLGLPDCGVENNISLRRMIEKFNPRNCLNIVHWPKDTHKDHREFSSAVYDSCRGKNILYYGSVSAQKFIPNIKFTIGLDILEEKCLRLKKAFDLDKYYLKENFLKKSMEEDCYHEDLFCENVDASKLKMLI